MGAAERIWNTQQTNRSARLARASAALGSHLHGKVVAAGAIAELLHQVVESGDRVCLEGNNQKQADFLAASLAGLDPARVNGLHMLLSVLALPEHLDVFERGIASKLDFSFSGPQAGRLAKLATSGPDAPLGRNAMSTRKVKPSSVISDKAAMNFLPSRVKNS